MVKVIFIKRSKRSVEEVDDTIFLDVLETMLLNKKVDEIIIYEK